MTRAGALQRGRREAPTHMYPSYDSLPAPSMHNVKEDQRKRMIHTLGAQWLPPPPSSRQPRSPQAGQSEYRVTPSHVPVREVPRRSRPVQEQHHPSHATISRAPSHDPGHSTAALLPAAGRTHLEAHTSRHTSRHTPGSSINASQHQRTSWQSSSTIRLVTSQHQPSPLRRMPVPKRNTPLDRLPSTPPSPSGHV